PLAEIIAGNNKEGDCNLGNFPLNFQEYMENYIQQFIPRTGWCITGSTCTTWKKNGSQGGGVIPSEARDLSKRRKITLSDENAAAHSMCGCCAYLASRALFVRFLALLGMTW